MTLAIELMSASPGVASAPQALAPAAAIPLQAGPSLTVSLTDGCEAPLDALKTAAADSIVRCHPCDEAIVRLLLTRLRREQQLLIATAAIVPGTLCLG